MTAIPTEKSAQKNAMTAARAHEVRIFESFEEISELAPSLSDEEAAADFYMTLSWFSLLDKYGIDPASGRVLPLIGSPDGGGVVCLPLLHRSKRTTLGQEDAFIALSNYYSSLYGPVGDPAAVTVDGLRAMVRVLAQRYGQPALWNLHPMDKSSSFFTRMQEALRLEGYSSDSYFCFGNWYHPVGGQSYADYLGKLPSKIRNTIARGRKKLDAAGAWTLVIHQAPGPELESAIADFTEVYNKSWKVPEPFPEFVPNLCRMAASKGWLRLGVVRLDDSPIAAQLWIVHGGRALIYKLAYVESHKRLSAGSVLTEAMMRHVFEVDRVDEIDYLTGDDAYKRDWMSQRRERHGLVAFNRRTAHGLMARKRPANPS